MLKAVKFGGSSCADAKQFKKVKDIVLSDPSRKIIVVSAPGKSKECDHKITDLLCLCVAHIEYGVSCEDIFGIIRRRFTQIAAECGVFPGIGDELDLLKLRMLDGMPHDELISRGEYFCARLTAEYLGYDFIDAASWVRFLPDGSVDVRSSCAALRLAASGRKAVTPGFYGVMPDGRIRTFTRGGSDITGALAAAALDADVYENWTDVPGILTADPRIVTDPYPIRRMTYGELRELSFLGAQVMHEEAVFPLREKHIPLNIRCTDDPSLSGTLILENIDDAEEETGFITGVTGKKGFSIVTAERSGMSSEAGAVTKALRVFDKRGINVYFIPSGIDSVSFVVRTKQTEECIYGIVSELKDVLNLSSVSVTDRIAVVAAVGRKMAFKPGVSGKVFAALGRNGINVRMITQGPNELNIIFGVDEKDYEKSVRVLYKSFVREKYI